MQLLVLGKGKTGSLAAEIAQERGHQVSSLDEHENANGEALTAERLAGIDAVIDFTTPEAVLTNLRAALPHGAHMVIGTTGWYAHLEEMKSLALRHNAGLIWSTNFSVGVQAMFRLAAELGRLEGYSFSISETHHITKKDAPSGTALSLKHTLEEAQPGLKIDITSHREGDASGIHVIEARSACDLITLRHEAFSRRGFAEGAVRAAEWIAGKHGCWDFSDVAGKL